MNQGPLGCVLAGGQSTRMGRDKALLPFKGKPLIEHALHALRAAGCEPVIAGSRADLAVYAPVLPDLHPGCGPLSGIEAALAYSARQHVLFVPVDLPLLPPAFLRLLLDRAACTGAQATVPMLGGRAQPLCAVYRRDLLPGISAALAAGEYKVMRVIEALARRDQRDVFAMEAVLAASGRTYTELPAPRWFANVNRPEDLASLTSGRGTEAESVHGTAHIH